MDVTDDTFEAAVLERSLDATVVVDLWAPWCGPCKTLGPILEKVVGETGGRVELAKVNGDGNPPGPQATGVRGRPAGGPGRRGLAAPSGGAGAGARGRGGGPGRAAGWAGRDGRGAG